MTPDFADFVTWFFYGVLGGGVVYGVRMLADMRDSMVSLNIKLAQVVEKTTWHEKEIRKHERRLLRLEEERVK
jgi:hypothetical protein